MFKKIVRRVSTDLVIDEISMRKHGILKCYVPVKISWLSKILFRFSLGLWEAREWQLYFFLINEAAKKDLYRQKCTV